MYKFHKRYIIFIVFLTQVILDIIPISLNQIFINNCLTFLYVLFISYVLTIGILFYSQGNKRRYKEEEKGQLKGQRLIHTLRDYLQYGTYYCLFSIIVLVSYSIKYSDISYKLPIMSLPFGLFLDLGNIFEGFIISSLAINIYFSLLLFHRLLDSMIEEAREKPDNP